MTPGALPEVSLGEMAVSGVKVMLRPLRGGAVRCTVAMVVRAVPLPCAPGDDPMTHDVMTHGAILRPRDAAELRRMVRDHVAEALALEVDEWLRFDGEHHRRHADATAGE